jgi:hypothetical protein
MTHNLFEFTAAEKSEAFATAVPKTHTWAGLQAELEQAWAGEPDESSPVIVIGKVNGVHIGATIKAVSYDRNAEGEVQVYLELDEVVT